MRRGAAEVDLRHDCSGFADALDPTNMNNLMASHRSARLSQQQTTPPEELGERRRAQLSQAGRHSIVRERPELLWHGEAPLTQPALGRSDLEMEGVREVSTRDRHG